jgi:iron complex outermembrane receptor protein
LLFGDAVTLADTETILSFEGGTKLRLWGQRLHLIMAVFHYFMQDQQLTAVGGETNFNRLVNAESTIGRGIEGELTLLPITSLEVSAGLSYNHARIGDPQLAVQGCGAPCTVLDPPASGTFSIDGNGLPQAPGWIADVTARYIVALPLGHTSSRLQTGLTAAGCGSSSTTPWNTPTIGFWRAVSDWLIYYQMTA